MTGLLQFVLPALLGSVPASAGETQAGPVGWSWPPYVIIPLLVTLVLYVVGLSRIRRKGSRLRTASVISFLAGWLSLLLALDSPLHELGEQLFWVHMTQHEVLVLVSAPLLVFSRPLIPLIFGLPSGWRDAALSAGRNAAFHRCWTAVSVPLVAWLLHGLALWVWHAPALFDATVESDFVHALQHISFLATALLFWWTLFGAQGTRLGYGGAALYVFTTAIHTSLLGALLTFSRVSWYTAYATSAAKWGFTPLEDQQFGGLIMWIPAGTVLFGITMFLLWQWMEMSQRRWQNSRFARLLRTPAGLPDEN